MHGGPQDAHLHAVQAYVRVRRVRARDHVLGMGFIGSFRWYWGRAKSTACRRTPGRGDSRSIVHSLILLLNIRVVKHKTLISNLVRLTLLPAEACALPSEGFVLFGEAMTLPPEANALPGEAPGRLRFRLRDIHKGAESATLNLGSVTLLQYLNTTRSGTFRNKQLICVSVTR